MRDIDELLTRHTLLPNRELKPAFTSDIVGQLRTRPNPRGLRALGQRLRTRIGLISISAILLIGGTAAAISFWPTPSVTMVVGKPLPTGNHIVGYNTENCNYFGTLDGSTPKTTSQNVYYEVRAGSKLTDAQIQSSLLAVCQQNVSNNMISLMEHQLPDNRKGDSSLDYTVNTISNSSITVSPDPHYNPAKYDVKPRQLYSRFDPNMLVFLGSSKSQLAAIRAGDTVVLITKDTSGRSLNGPSGYQPANHPENQLIEGILKIPALTADPSVLYTAFATDIVRLDPCMSDPSGYCRAYNFQ